MKFITFTLFFFLVTKCLFSQDIIYSCESDGSINSMDRFCCKKKICDFPVFLDIAATPNATVWAVSDKIYELDIDNCSIVSSFEPLDYLGINRVGNGLVALNDETLITDYNDSLFKIDLNTYESQYVGTTGYYCSGDFEFIAGDIYMSTDLNQIVKIKLSPNYTSIESTEVVVDLGPGFSIYGLFDFSSNQKQLLGFSRGQNIFYVTLNTKEIEQVCSLTGAEIFGATTIPLDNSNKIESINVLTPNNDGVNDLIFISEKTGIEHFEVLNRWGNQIFTSSTFPMDWNGRDDNGQEISEGIYFIKTTYRSCQLNKNEYVNEITLFR